VIIFLKQIATKQETRFLLPFLLRCIFITQLCFLVITMLTFPHVLASECKKISLPVSYDAFGLPTIGIEINGVRHQALIDIGSAEAIHLPAKLTKSMSSLHYNGETVASSNLLGEVIEQKRFIIEELKLDCMTFSDLQGLELSE
jgi:hypothetical protein